MQISSDTPLWLLSMSFRTFGTLRINSAEESLSVEILHFVQDDSQYITLPQDSATHDKTLSGLTPMHWTRQCGFFFAKNYLDL